MSKVGDFEDGVLFVCWRTLGRTGMHQRTSGAGKPGSAVFDLQVAPPVEAVKGDVAPRVLEHVLHNIVRCKVQTLCQLMMGNVIVHLLTTRQLPGACDVQQGGIQGREALH